MKEILKLANVSYKYEDKYPALIDVSATIYEGEKIAVLGNNGAGKSTFFLCCNGVLHPQGGKLFLFGEEITTSKKDLTKLRETVGLVFQDPDTQIIAGTVESEVSFGPMNLKLDYEEIERRITESLSIMNLEGYQERAPQYLSGGEKKRVSIADILAMEPEMILFDEPTASLDPENVNLLEMTLEDLNNKGITLVIATHDVDFAYQFADRVIVFSRGKIIADASMEEVLASENILSQAGLTKPLIYSAAEVLEKHFPQLNEQKTPKTIEELSEFVSTIE